MVSNLDLTNIKDILKCMKESRLSSFGDNNDEVFSLVNEAHKQDSENIELKGALAYCYTFGVGCSEDKNRALELLSDFKEQTTPEYAVGYYAKAYAISHEFGSDEHLLLGCKAADLGVAHAQDWVGSAYGGHDSGEDNHAKMVHYTEMAAAQGIASSIERLVFINIGDYSELKDSMSDGFKPDYDRACVLAKQLIEDGQADGLISILSDGFEYYYELTGKFHDATSARDVYKSNEAMLKILGLYNQNKFDVAQQELKEPVQE